MNQCGIAGCGEKTYARGLCSACYQMIYMYHLKKGKAHCLAFAKKVARRNARIPTILSES